MADTTATLPAEDTLAPDRAAQPNPTPIEPTDEDVPTPDLEDMAAGADDEDQPTEPVTITQDGEHA